MEEGATKKQKTDEVGRSDGPNLLLNLPRDIKQSIFLNLCSLVETFENGSLIRIRVISVP